MMTCAFCQAPFERAKGTRRIFCSSQCCRRSHYPPRKPAPPPAPEPPLPRCKPVALTVVPLPLGTCPECNRVDVYRYRAPRTAAARCFQCLRAWALRDRGMVIPRDPRFEPDVDRCTAGHPLPYGKRNRADCPTCIVERKRRERARHKLMKEAA